MTFEKWTADRPHTLVVACSDGRLQDQTDEFLHVRLGLRGFDRFYVPGGGGALASSGRDFLRAQQLRQECAYLIGLHKVEHVILLFHGPSDFGPPDAVCADYRRKFPYETPAALHNQQLVDALDLIAISPTWAGSADVRAFRCQIGGSSDVTFSPLDTPL